MNSWGRIEENYAYFWHQNFAMPVLNCLNIKTETKTIKENEIKIFIKQYDKNGKIILPVWETSGRNFDVKK